MKISLIVAASENNVIGRDNELPWQLPDDLKRFRRLTEGHPIIMGRKCHESIGRPLPNRENIVITRQDEYVSEGCTVVGSLHEAIKNAVDTGAEEAFVIGGGEIYNHALLEDLVDRVYFTQVHAEVDGDIVFPEIDTEVWNEVSTEEHPADDEHTYAFTHHIFDRK